MPWAAAAAVGGAVIGAVATNSAADKQAGAANRATDIENQNYQQTRTDNMPALNARNASLQRLQDLLGISGNTSATDYGSLGGTIDPTKVASTPGYQFGLKQGQTTLNNNEVARGMSNSGQALKAAAQYGTDYATTKQGDYLNQEIAARNAVFQPLESVAGLSQSGANTVAASGSNAANQAAQNAISAGNTSAAATLATGNQITGAANQLAGWYNNQKTPTYTTPTQFQDGTTFYGGSGSTLYGDGFGPQ